MFGNFGVSKSLLCHKSGNTANTVGPQSFVWLPFRCAAAWSKLALSEPFAKGKEKRS
jgi:hypothetical protein